jgi:hypothetical protein
LLRIMQRRSVADAKQFLCCLDELGCKTVVNWLTEEGAVARIRTTINYPEMSMKEKIEKYKGFKHHFNKADESEEDKTALKFCERMALEVRCVKVEEGIVWYIVCRTLQSLEHMRQLNDSLSNQFANLLQCIFNGLHGSSEKVQLSVEWTGGDYKNCKSFLNNTSGRPFDLPRRYLELDNIPASAVSNSHVMFNCLYLTTNICYFKHKSILECNCLFQILVMGDLSKKVSWTKCLGAAKLTKIQQFNFCF